MRLVIVSSALKMKIRVYVKERRLKMDKERRLKIDENFKLINVLNEFIYERGELNNPTDNRKCWLVQRIRN